MKQTIRSLNKMKAEGKKLTFMTSYDYQMARLSEQAGIDMLLIGDSVGNNVLGYTDTRPVTMDEMIIFSRAVRKGAPNTFIVGDMPLGSYQPSDEEAIRNAIRFVKEAEVDAIKCEGGARVAPRVRAMNDAGVATMGHIGYTPQSTNIEGVVQGNSLDRFIEVHSDAQALENAGAFAVLLEAVPNKPAGYIARDLSIPVYGIGAGKEVDGVLAIAHDVLGLGTFESKFVRKFFDANSALEDAMKRYASSVRDGSFPSLEECYKLKPEEEEGITKYMGEVAYL